MSPCIPFELPICPLFKSSAHIHAIDAIEMLREQEIAGMVGKGFVKLHASSTAARRDWLGRARGFAPTACSLEHSDHESMRGVQNPRQAASEFLGLPGLAKVTLAFRPTPPSGMVLLKLGRFLPIYSNDTALR